MAADPESTAMATDSGSPSPNLLPTPVSGLFSSNRSFSGLSSTSSQSSLSNASTNTRSTSGSASRRRGYVRPQGASFAPSAQNRESVMSLGSIAHLQYYFARTGLLDGKGGQLAKKKKNGEYDIPKLSICENKDYVESPIEEEGQLLWEAVQEDGEDVMLPPTVSTYSHRSHYVPPPPDQKTLKRDLVEALENALQALESCEKTASDKSEVPTQGFYEIQGLHVLDTSTLAIRAARLYYTMHPHPQRLHSIRSDQQLRKDLYDVLEVLKKCAARKFAGGFREDERLAVLIWVSDVGMMIDQEAKLDEVDKQERQDWHWMDDSKWLGNEEAQDLNFLHFLLPNSSNNSQRRPSSTEPNTFFKALADGRDLVRMHNNAVKQSKKHFCQIESFHNDILKPYRRADNLRFWLKAAELRWELRLKLDVMAVATAPDDSIWKSFEDVVRQWSRGVRAELAKDWNGEEERRLHARARSLALASPIGSPARKQSMATFVEESDAPSMSSMCV